MFLIISNFIDFEYGIEIGLNFQQFFRSMIGIIPAAFILISLFEVWVKRETVEKHLGEKSQVLGIIWAVILAGTIVGGLYVALPLAVAMFKKGARVDVVFTFLFAATICRIPMTIFEANILGVKFTLIRFLVALPLVIISSIILGKISEKYGLLSQMKSK